MPVQITRKVQLTDTHRHVRNETYETYRFLLASDDAEVTLTDIVLAPDIEAVYGYEQYIEIAYCIEGNAELTDLSTGQVHSITSGTFMGCSTRRAVSFSSKPTDAANLCI